MNHIVSDYIIRLKNAVLARRRSVVFPQTRMTKALSDVLVKERYLKSVKEDVVEGRKVLVGEIAYGKEEAAFSDVVLFSKPSLRVYVTAKDKRLRGLGVAVVSTNKGIMTGKEASEKGFGGELLFRVW